MCCLMLRQLREQASNIELTLTKHGISSSIETMSNALLIFCLVGHVSIGQSRESIFLFFLFLRLLLACLLHSLPYCQLRMLWGTPGPKHHIASSACCGARLDPNTCQIECQTECQNRRQTECQRDCQIECHGRCQIECRKECQNRCQKEYRIECRSICQKEYQIERQNVYAMYTSR